MEHEKCRKLAMIALTGVGSCFARADCPSLDLMVKLCGPNKWTMMTHIAQDSGQTLAICGHSWPGDDIGGDIAEPVGWFMAVDRDPFWVGNSKGVTLVSSRPDPFALGSSHALHDFDSMLDRILPIATGVFVINVAVGTWSAEFNAAYLSANLARIPMRLVGSFTMTHPSECGCEFTDVNVYAPDDPIFSCGVAGCIVAWGKEGSMANTGGFKIGWSNSPIFSEEATDRHVPGMESGENGKQRIATMVAVDATRPNASIPRRSCALQPPLIRMPCIDHVNFNGAAPLGRSACDPDPSTFRSNSKLAATFVRKPEDRTGSEGEFLNEPSQYAGRRCSV